MKYTRKNDDLLPFEAGGEAKLEHFASKTDCGQFVLASHTKKRPHNLILGRFFDHRLYDLLEVGVVNYRAIKSFGSAASAVQAENKVGARGSGSCLTCVHYVGSTCMALLSACMALLSACMALLSVCMAVLSARMTLLSVSTALPSVCLALLPVCMALLSVCMSLLSACMALLPTCMALTPTCMAV